MDYFDLHVRFPFPNHREAGFSGIGLWGRELEEFEDHKQSEKLTLVDSRDIDYIKPRIKRCSLIHDPEYKLDLGTMRAVAKAEKAYEIPVRPLLTSSGTARAEQMRRMSRFLRLCNKFGVDYALTSRARDVYEAKFPAEMVAIGCSLGLSYDQALRAITEVPKHLLKVRK